MEKRKSLLGNVASPISTTESTAEDTNATGLVDEAQMALATIALYKKDTVRALRLYSRVKTPHAAWNQSQVCVVVYILDYEGGREPYESVLILWHVYFFLMF